MGGSAKFHLVCAFDMEIIFHSKANKTHFHKRDCTLGLILKVNVFGTQKWSVFVDRAFQSVFPINSGSSHVFS